MSSYKIPSNNNSIKSNISNIPDIIKLLSMSEKDIYDEIKIFLDALENNYYDYKSKESECELLGGFTKDNNEYNKLKDYIQEYIEKSNDIKDLINEYSNSKNNSVKQSKKDRIEKLIKDLLDTLVKIMSINNSSILEPIFLIIYEITLFEKSNGSIDIKDKITKLNEEILSLLKNLDRSERKKSQEKQIDSLKKRQLLEKEKKSLEDKKGKLELDLQKYIQKNPIDDTIQKQIDSRKKEIENKEKEITKKKSNISPLNRSINRQRTTIEKYEANIESFEKQIDKLTKEINNLEIKFDQANRKKIQYQKNLYERPIRLLEIKIDSIDKSIKDIDEKSKNSGQTDMTPISNAEKDYFNYVINFINIATSGKDSKNIIQRMFENDSIVKIYSDTSKDRLKELKKISFFRKQDESFFNFFQRGGANSVPEPFTETVKKYMLDIKKVNTFYVDAYFNYLARVNKEFNIYIQQLFLRLDSAMKTGVDHTNDLCEKLLKTNDKLDIIIKKIKDSSSSSSINNSDYTKNLYPYTDFILAYFMILVYFVNLLIMKILGCPPTSPVASSSGSPVANSTESLPPGILTIICNEIKIYVRKEDRNIIEEMIKRIEKNKIISKHLNKYVDYHGKIWKINNYNAANNTYTIIPMNNNNKNPSKSSFNTLEKMSITSRQPSSPTTLPPASSATSSDARLNKGSQIKNGSTHGLTKKLLSRLLTRAILAKSSATSSATSSAKSSDAILKKGSQIKHGSKHGLKKGSQIKHGSKHRLKKELLSKLLSKAILAKSSLRSSTKKRKSNVSINSKGTNNDLMNTN